MKGHPEVITALNECLTAELTAVHQYLLHAKICENWGFARLAQEKLRESGEERDDAEKLVGRILFLDGTPDVQRMDTVRIGDSVLEIQRSDLAMEVAHVERLNRAITLARDKGDNGTRELLEQILAGEEEAVDHLEAQLHLIEHLGPQVYLAEMMGPAAEA